MPRRPSHVLMLSFFLALTGLSAAVAPAGAETVYTVDVATDDLLTVDSGTGNATVIFHFDRDMRSVDLALSPDGTKLYAVDYLSGVSMDILTITLTPGPIGYTVMPVTLNGILPNSDTSPTFPDFNCGGNVGHTAAEGLAFADGKLVIGFSKWTTESPANCASLSNMIGYLNPVDGVIEPLSPAPFDLMTLKNAASPNCFDCPFGSTCSPDLACRADIDGMTALPNGHFLVVDNINDGRWNSPQRVEFVDVSWPVSPAFAVKGPAILANAGAGANDVALSCDPATFFLIDFSGGGVLRSVNLSDGSLVSTTPITRSGSYEGLALVPCEQRAGNCPRTAGFWTQQCAQAAGGSTKFDAAQVTQIAECVDTKAAIFTWPGTTDFASFCATVNPPSPVNQRNQAKRQYLTLLANVCTGQLGLIANNGNRIALNLDTPIACGGLSSTTIGGLIGEVDARLVSLDGQPLNDTVKKDYSKLIACLDAINNGIGIGTVCPEVAAAPSRSPALAGGMTGRALAAPPTPNPFSQRTSFALAVDGESRHVDVRIFDVTGRLIRTISTGVLPAGRHEMGWDGFSDQRKRVPAGVYFLRTAVGGEATVTRLMYMR